jgi:hypothetical protein
MTNLVPSWISTLSTSSIEADMTAADVNGTVTYAGLVKLLDDLDSLLTSSGSSLTSAELSDLKTIASHLNSGMTTSSYLTTIMGDLVSGSPANATWTGGGSASTALGNLAIGSSAMQLSDLIGKWFLGTDLPSSKVVMSGESTFSVSYSTVSSPLFSSTGPRISDVNQGYLGDCFFLSSAAEVASQNSNIITSMFTSNGNNTYGVRFYIDGVAEYVTVNNSLADGGTIFNEGTDIWASLAEKAYAQLQAGGVVTGNTVNDGDSWSTIGNGGAPEFALEEITGASQITDYSASNGSWTTINYNASLQETGYATRGSTASVLSILATDLAEGDDAILSSYTNATDASGHQTLVADHAMSIYGYDSSSGMLEIRNPWGTMAGQYWDTTFEVSLSTLLSDGDTVTVDNAGTDPAISILPRADLLGTDTSEVCFYNPTTGDVGYWSFGSGGTSAAWHDFNQGSTTVGAVGTGDFAGNGIDGILWQNPTNNLVGDWLMNNGQPTWQLVGQGSTTMNIAGIGDFTGNGTDDILWQNPTNNLVGDWQMKNNTPTWELIGQGSTTMNIAGVGDFTGNGTDDILWLNPTNNLVGEWQMNNNTPTWELIGQGSTTMKIVGVGDFTGNGKDDILWENPTNNLVGAWLMNGANYAWQQLGTAPTGYQAAAIGDYNGDGTSDILWRNASTGDVGVWLMNNGSPAWHDLGTSPTGFNVIKT